MAAIFDPAGSPGFNRVVLVEYPRRGIWTYGFVTGRMDAGPRAGQSSEFVKLFIPKAPNPTTGYYVLVPREDVRDSRLTVDEAFRAIISAGIATTQFDEPGDRIEFTAPAAVSAPAPRGRKPDERAGT